MQKAIVVLAAAAMALALPAHELEKRQSGQATFYYQNGHAGSCGQYHSDSDYIGALSTAYMKAGSNYCGRQVKITNTGGGQNNYGQGKSVTITVADTCEGCSANQIDLATGPFKALTGGQLDPPGEFSISWSFV